jgi:putative transposase
VRSNYNSPQVESFLKTLKQVEIYSHDHASLQDGIERLPHFLEEVQDRKRLHPGLLASG